MSLIHHIIPQKQIITTDFIAKMLAINGVTYQILTEEEWNGLIQKATFKNNFEDVFGK